MQNNHDGEKSVDTEEREAERRRRERRQRDEPVLLDTRAPGERRGRNEDRNGAPPAEQAGDKGKT